MTGVKHSEGEQIAEEEAQLCLQPFLKNVQAAESSARSRRRVQGVLKREPGIGK